MKLLVSYRLPTEYCRVDRQDQESDSGEKASVSLSLNQQSASAQMLDADLRRDECDLCRRAARCRHGEDGDDRPRMCSNSPVPAGRDERKGKNVQNHYVVLERVVQNPISKADHLPIQCSLLSWPIPLFSRRGRFPHVSSPRCDGAAHAKSGGGRHRPRPAHCRIRSPARVCRGDRDRGGSRAGGRRIIAFPFFIFLPYCYLQNVPTSDENRSLRRGPSPPQ